MELWYTEKHLPGLKFSLKVDKTYYTGKSQYQRIDIFETVEYGKMLTLDGLAMVATRDEFVYHEMMAHLPSNIHPRPRKALVIGGGDGGTIRELIKHESYQELHLCEIDQLLVEQCMIHLPETSSKLTDKKVKLFYQDGIEFIKNKKNCYDVICIDSTDPIGPAVGLFKQEFYQDCFQALTEDGVLIAQTESPWYNPDIIKDCQESFQKIFPNVGVALASIIEYPSGLWSFSIGSKKYHPIEDLQIERADSLNTEYYNPDIHRSSFSLPNFLKKILNR